MKKKRILVYGDSNSWGWTPQKEIIPTERYDLDKTWPYVMAEKLGGGFDIVVDALNGRTTCIDDPEAVISGVGLNGEAYLPAALGSHFPLDLVIIMLGVNDTKEPYHRSPLDIALGILSLASIVQSSTGVLTIYPPANVFIIAPPPLGTIASVDWLQELFSENSVRKSREVAGVLEPLAKGAGFAFFDAGSVISTGGSDGVHFTEENHHTIGLAIAKQVSKYFG